MVAFADLRAVLAAKSWHMSQWLAWALLALWAVVWIPFSLLAGLFEIGDLGVLALLMHLILPVLIVLVVWLCWKWPVIGAGTAVLASFVLMLWYGFGSWIVAVLLDFPPLLAGILLAVAWLRYSAELRVGEPDPHNDT
jgi:hypothetical protein